jgi:cytoskeleton protein RodZ
MEVASLAQQLHLSKTMVQALEEENYDILPARVFVRGYYRNYARLVNVPEEVVLTEFEKRCPEGEDCSVPPAVAQGVKKEIRSSHGVVRLVSWLVVIALLTTFGLWWKSNLDKDTASVSDDGAAGGANTDTAQNAPVMMPNAETAAVGQPDKNRIPEPGQPAQVAPQAQGSGVSRQERPALEENREGSESEKRSGNAPGVAELKADPVPEPAAETALPRIVLSFKGDCWVDVRGANRSFKIVGKRKAGEEIELGGEPPYKMVLGNARNVSVLVNGKSYDLAPHTRGNVVKLTLNPTAE